LKPRFAPSLMCLDWNRAGEQITILDQYSDAYHFDIMDGHFCPNLTLSPMLLPHIHTTLPIEAHLMTTEPDHWIDACAEGGAKSITLHLETITANAFRLFRKIRDLGCSSGLALCPSTPFAQAEPLLEEIDMLTMMTVDIGFAGQPFLPAVLKKIQQASKYRSKHWLHFLLQADGGCNQSTFTLLRRAGIDQFVLGSALFTQSDDLNATYSKITGEVFE